MVHRGSPNTFTLIDRSEHERKRRIVSQGFSDAALRSYEGKILICIAKLAQQFAPDAVVLNDDFDAFRTLRTDGKSVADTTDSEGWTISKDVGELGKSDLFLDLLAVQLQSQDR